MMRAVVETAIGTQACPAARNQHTGFLQSINGPNDPVMGPLDITIRVTRLGHLSSMGPVTLTTAFQSRRPAPGDGYLRASKGYARDSQVSPSRGGVRNGSNLLTLVLLSIDGLWRAVQLRVTHAGNHGPRIGRQEV